MSGRTQFWIGSVMMALAIGLLVGGAIFPKAAYSQEGEGRTGRYALGTGIPGSTQRSQTPPMRPKGRVSITINVSESRRKFR